ncbi:hypothetical protein VIGAN_01289400 [Vigna angularis var. angularis]|uniref:Rhamnogalacturonan lyase domain-containing protein n=1 Tax=Vigna angularis var. angularis TaxID=157739 RepID=A0A0S3R392_PHAAN|nr:hypothetical protein VIGAN_01289400 [Vigna angularis var. angularis]
MKRKNAKWDEIMERDDEGAERYQHLSKANEKGYFSIENIRSGDYNLYAWVPGFIGEY